MPKNEPNKNAPKRDAPGHLAGRLLALDLGEKRTGVAVSDEMQIAVRPIQVLRSTNWKKLLSEVKGLINEFDAKALVIGLPLSLDGSERSAANKAMQMARKFSLSLDVPVLMQDERLTSDAAKGSLTASGYTYQEMESRLDGESAAIILRDFIADPSSRLEIKPSVEDIASDQSTD